MKKYIFAVATAFAAFSVCAVAQSEKPDYSETSSTVATVENNGKAEVRTEVKNYEEYNENGVLVNDINANWEMDLRVGTQAYLGEYIPGGYFKFKDWWAPAIDFSMNKWASPFFGLGFGLNFAQYRGLYGGSDDKATFAHRDSDYLYQDYQNMYFAKGWYGNLFLQLSFNFTSLFRKGWKSDAIFDWTGYFGGGVVMPCCKVDYFAVGASFNAGMKFDFKVATRLKLGIGLRGALYSDGFNGISYASSHDKDNIPLDGMIGITVGAVYKFGFVTREDHRTGESQTNEWVPTYVAIQTSEVTNDIVNTAVAEKNEIIREREDTIKAKDIQIKNLKDENRRIRKTAMPYQPKYWSYVNFQIDKWDISNAQKVNIMAAADFIKTCPDRTFVISGYADKQTATSSRNKFLAEKRVEAVSRVLVNEYGINPNQLEKADYGGVDYMYFDDPQCSRAVLIYLK
ncbi:MAG: OmpA family protein [Bacteroidales bacterium]|nr:OmpA family protein [Bacteroidales bacterium]